MCTVPRPLSVSAAVSPPPPHYTGLDLTLACTVSGTQIPGIKVDVQITNPQAMLIANSTRITVENVAEVIQGSLFIQSVQFRPLSALSDSGTFTCSASFIPAQPNDFVVSSTSSVGSVNIEVTG